jgi:hypothetical protein
MRLSLLDKMQLYSMVFEVVRVVTPQRSGITFERSSHYASDSLGCLLLLVLVERKEWQTTKRVCSSYSFEDSYSK